MNRREFVGTAAAASLLGALTGSAAAAARAGTQQIAGAGSFDPEEKSCAELAAALESGAATSASLTSAYLSRIEKLNRAGPELNCVIATNPLALSIARDLDAERKAGRVRGPLHGLPILIKDNIETLDPLPTTAGSLALAQAYHEVDAPLAARLRAAGAVMLGKTNLSEWANFRSARAVSGWSAVGGQTRNPYATRFNPSGSSSGSAAAAAASLCAAAIGTETDGSILAPASRCGLVGFKPTVGLVSAAGVVPISPRQDTAGPLARSVADAALLFDALAQREFAHRPTLESLEGFRLDGMRVGILAPSASAHPDAAKRWPEWYRPLAGEGAILVDVAPPKTLALMGDVESEVLLWEFKAAINDYLSRLQHLEVRTLTDLIAFNRAHAVEEMPLFGQDLFEDADKRGGLAAPAYQKARDRLMNLADKTGLASMFARYRVDVLLAVSGGPAEPIDPVWGDRSDSGGWPAIASAAAVAGYPSLTVPAGLVRGLPVGAIFVAPRYHDGVLLEVGHAYERATRARRPPTYATG